MTVDDILALAREGHRLVEEQRADLARFEQLNAQTQRLIEALRARQTDLKAISAVVKERDQRIELIVSALKSAQGGAS